MRTLFEPEAAQLPETSERSEANPFGSLALALSILCEKPGYCRAFLFNRRVSRGTRMRTPFEPETSERSEANPLCQKRSCFTDVH
ncbi:hypothetical protein Maes01_02763 [Microbulbifer aestuariivivens]|uniref:Uncharacterized protein n=2 Tax=Microbulbifer aestuariivivens TaxID=1908308 RepID=A0ABP9WU87_9GAMM